MKSHAHALAALTAFLLGLLLVPQVSQALDIPRPVQQMKRAKQVKREMPAEESSQSAISLKSVSRKSSKLAKTFSADDGRKSDSQNPHWGYIVAAVVVGLVIVGRFPVAIFAIAPILLIILIYIAIKSLF